MLDPHVNNLKKYPIYIHVFEPLKKEFYQNMTTQELANYVQNLVSNKLVELRKIDEENLNKYKR